MTSRPPSPGGCRALVVHYDLPCNPRRIERRSRRCHRSRSQLRRNQVWLVLLNVVGGDACIGSPQWA